MYPTGVHPFLPSPVLRDGTLFCSHLHSWALQTNKQMYQRLQYILGTYKYKTPLNYNFRRVMSLRFLRRRFFQSVERVLEEHVVSGLFLGSRGVHRVVLPLLLLVLAHVRALASSNPEKRRSCSRRPRRRTVLAANPSGLSAYGCGPVGW